MLFLRSQIPIRLLFIEPFRSDVGNQNINQEIKLSKFRLQLNLIRC